MDKSKICSAFKAEIRMLQTRKQNSKLATKVIPKLKSGIKDGKQWTFYHYDSSQPDSISPKLPLYNQTNSLQRVKRECDSYN